MVELYRQESRTIWQPVSFVQADITLIDFLVKDTRIVEGQKFVQKGTSEWYAHLERQRNEAAKHNKKLTADDIRELVDKKLGESAFLPVEDTGFEAVHYSKYFDEILQTGTISYDRKQNLIGVISHPHQRIEVFRLKHDKDRYPVQDVHWFDTLFYNGTLREALTEYAATGFTFAWWDIPWNISLINNGQRTVNAVPSAENLTLDELFALAGQKKTE